MAHPQSLRRSLAVYHSHRLHQVVCHSLRQAGCRRISSSRSPRRAPEERLHLPERRVLEERRRRGWGRRVDKRGDELVVEMEVGVKLSVRCAMWDCGEEEKSYREMI